MFGKVKEFFQKIDDDEAKKIKEGKELEETAKEMMKGDKASPEVLGEEKENIEEEKERE